MQMVVAVAVVYFLAAQCRVDRAAVVAERLVRLSGSVATAIAVDWVYLIVEMALVLVAEVEVLK